MDEVVREALASREQFDGYDAHEAAIIFGRLNEQWEEMFAEVGTAGQEEVFIPRGFLDGRKAFIFHMFYRVVEMHDQEVKAIEAKGEVD